MAGEFTKRSDAMNPPTASKYWLIQLENASKVEERYRKTADRLTKKYENEESQKVTFNIFWANTETLKPAVYSKRPGPDVRQRKQIKDPNGNVAAQVLELGVKYTTDCSSGYDFDTEKEYMRDQMLITGRGLTRFVYIANQVEIINPTTKAKETAIGNQTLREYAVDYKDFRMSPANTWRDVYWVAFRHKPTRDELIKQFGSEVGEKVPLNYTIISEGVDSGGKDKDNDVFRRAVVWEIWDKIARKRVWIAEGYDDILLSEPDPYKLEDFFPMAQPLYGFKAPGSMIPRAEYQIYEEQAMVVNLTSAKIEEITNALEAKGVYPAVADEIKKLADASNGSLIGINLALGSDINSLIAWWPVDKIAVVLQTLYQARADAINVIYQITGLSDLMRGSTDPNETAAAQKLKGGFGNLRMNPRTAPMQRHIRDSYKIAAEIIAEHFTKANLEQIYGQPISDEVMSILRNDKLRNFSVDIETENTVQPDADTDKQQRIDFITAVTGFIKEMAPLVQAGMVPADVAKSMLSFGIKGFKTGRELEDAVEAIGEMPPQQQQQPDPETMKIQAEQQIQQGKLQIENQKINMQLKADQAKAQADFEIEKAKVEMQMELEKYKHQQSMELEKYKADLDAQTKLQIARINGTVSLEQAEITAQSKQVENDNQHA